MQPSTETDWRAAIHLAPDPYAAAGDRWIGSLPADVNWFRLEDRLIARGWYPKNAIARLRVYGCTLGADGPRAHEIVIEPCSRQVVIRIAEPHGDADALRVVERLALALGECAELGTSPTSHAA